MIRKAVILAAGVGSRLGDLTRDVPKPLIPIGDTCPLQRHLEACAAGGVEEVFINTHHLPEKIRDFVGDGSRFGLRATYSFEPELMGTAGALHGFGDALKREDFFLIYGDNLIACNLENLALQHKASLALATIALHHRDDVSTSGMVVLDANARIVRFVEKPPKSEQVSNLVNAGIYALSPLVINLLPPGPSDFGKDIFPAMLSKNMLMQGVILDSSVLPIDTPELLAIARKGREE